MPYAFAHPAAAIPLARLLGARAVPSALAIGSMTPDLWYFLPFLSRPDTHAASGLLLCLPAALIGYAAFHLVFKQPLLALFPPALRSRLEPWAAHGLPRRAWGAVLLSLALGIATHLAWDALTHPGLLSRRIALLRDVLFTLQGAEVRVHQVLQHASTLLGTLFIAWWAWRKLRAVPASLAPPAGLTSRARLGVLACFACASGGAFLFTFLAIAALDAEAWREALRAGAVSAASILGIAALAYCMAWRRM